MVNLRMNMLIALCCLAFAALGVSARGYPPSITIPQGNKWSKTKEYVRKANEMSFECKANAEPPAKYYWTVNGTRVEMNTQVITFDENTGTLTTGPYFGELHSGDYQCFALNDHGTAMTPVVKILATVANAFKGQGVSTDDMTVYASNYLKLECKDVPLSVPQWSFSWESGSFLSGGKLESSTVNLGDRMVIDQSGSLHFLWTESSDNNKIYACATKNEVLLVEVRNTHTIRLTVNDGRRSDRQPELKYKSDVEVFAGDTAELMCIFTYYSSLGERLHINWFHSGEKVGEGNVLTLPNVQLPDDKQDMEGEYMCEAVLGDNKKYEIVNLKIVAPPAFVKDMEPETKSVPVEKDAVFNCETTSHNSDSYPPVWFVNAKPLLGCPDYHFECKEKMSDGFSRCVPEKQVCNSDPDCPDGSDEQNCLGTCSEGQIWCTDRCIPANSPCNPLVCDYPGFMCHNKKNCLPRDKVCNGNPDCTDGSDELACPGGDPIKRNRFHINSQRTQLTLPNVGLTDSMCFQCLVRNQYGSTVGDACLTVIDKIVVLRGPNSTYDVMPGTVLEINVEASTDKLWQKQMKYNWQWYVEETDTKTGNVHLVPEKLPPTGPVGSYFGMSQTGKSMVISFPEVPDDDKAAYNAYYTLKDRQYTLIIEHRYDRVELNFTISGVEITKPTGAPVVEAAATNLWFIALILAILILFIVVALIVCYMYRNRGGTYPLDKKEHQAGHDPAQELKDSGFHDVGRVDDDYDDDKPRADEASLSESVKPYESDDDPTEEYGGDFDVSKFNEDGSFIGLYGDKKSKYSSKEATV